MNPGQSPPPGDANEEISALIETLHATGQRLEELTAGEVDTVADRDGRTFLLRRAQDHLRHSEAAKQAAILNALPAHIALLDTQGRIISVNEAWRRFASANVLQGPGYGIGLNYLGICDSARGDNASEAHQVAAGIRSVLGGGVKSFSIEYPCHSPTEQRWFLLTVTPLADDHPNGAVVMHLNITERKRVEDALREGENRLSAVFRASPIGISVSRVADGKILEVNDAALRLYGCTRDEVIGRTVAKLGTYANPVQCEELAQRLRVQGQVERFEIDFRNSSGAVGKLELTGRVIELQGEQCLAAMMVDVTERKRLEEVHLQAQKLESLGTLAGGIAHDFNNILAAILGNADLAAEHVGPDHIAAESLEEIRKASARAHDLVRRIMAFGRPKQAQQEEVDLSAVVGEVLKLLRSTLPAGISLNKDFAKDTPHVVADGGQIHEAIVNLTTNAAYAIGPRAGSIEYRLEPVQVGDKLACSVPGLKQGRYARLTVSDSGCGMDAATLERIFDAFYTTKPVGEGTGLGLSMVHGIMRSHGGVVTVESTPGKGSSFALYFPAAREQAVKEDESASAQSLLTAGQRVLYVDDEEALVFLAERVLSRLGHSISGFTDPEEALEAFRAHPQDFDIVVTDLSMPRMSGFDLTREVLAVCPGMPVLMTTGYLRAEDEGSARAAGIRELILKPTTMDELGRVLDRLFRDTHGDSQNGQRTAGIQFRR